MYQRVPSPDAVQNVARPRSIVRVRPPRKSSSARCGCLGMP